MKTTTRTSLRSPALALRLMFAPALAGTVLLAAAGSLRAQSSEFVSGTSWNTAGDWSPSGVPGSTSTVVLDSGSPGGAYTVNSSLQIGNLTFSTATASTLNATTTSSLTLDGQGAGVPLIALNSAVNLSIGNTSSLSLGVVLGGSNNTVDSSSTGALIVNSVISGGGGLNFTNTTGSGSATITLSGANTFTGGLAVTGHNIVVDVNGDAALGAAGGSVTVNGGRLEISKSTTIDPTRAFLLGSNPGGINTNGTISIKGGSTTVTIAGVIQDLNGSTHGDLVKQGSGPLVLGGANTYTGGTYLNNGVTKLLAANVLPSTTSVSLGQTASANLGTLDLNGTNQQFAGLNSVVGTNTTTNSNVVTSTAAATLTLNSSGNFTYGSSTTTNSGVISGAISLVKSGSGTQALGGVNTYTGTTTVNGGILAINGSTAAASAVTVNNAILAGAGTINGAVTVNNLGVLSPGSGIGTGGVLTLANNLTLNGGSTLNFDLSTAAPGQLVLSGTGVALNGPGSGLVNINLVDIDGTEALGSTLTLVSVTNAPGSAINWGVGDFTLETPAEWGGSVLSLGANDSLQVTLEASTVPEPSTYAGLAGLLALAGAAYARRRNRRAA